MCPHCGYDLVRNGPILIDRWSMMSPNAPLFFEQMQIRLTPSESELCYTLMKAFPRTVSHENIIERLGSTAETTNIVAVWVTKTKARIERAGAPIPIKSDWGRGYRWLSDGELTIPIGDGHRLFPEQKSKRWHD